MTMQKKPFILLMLLTMSSASRAATDGFGSFMGVGWIWILALFLYVGIGGLFALALCRAAAVADVSEEAIYEAALKRARAATATAAALEAHSRIGHPAIEATAEVG